MTVLQLKFLMIYLFRFNKPLLNLTRLMEIATLHYKNRVRVVPWRVLKPARASALFRARCKDRIVSVLACGVGRMLRLAGYPS